MKTVEDLTNAIGSPGRFQIMLCAILSCSYLFTCFGHLGMAFYAAKTDHHCFLPNSSTTSIKYSIPNDGKNGKDQCHLSYGLIKPRKHPVFLVGRIIFMGKKNHHFRVESCLRQHVQKQRCHCAVFLWSDVGNNCHRINYFHISIFTSMRST
ncbi:uncharacterized protein LOC124439308 [Xenia sp. Carnegie-2017]|uniref:uncharacterized protein LOC124439308 n=1 Tax=Xenia sp. Carnegie-2017 TaxID=2897299 RepID=UPI001F033972|nr:uncharacterized protein LOC124439308 [Xenia sp. Carnegie-2017]